MATVDHQFCLPGKVDSYLAALSRLYERNGETLLREIMINSVVSIHEGWDHDNWNGGTYGHAITLTIAEELYLTIIDRRDDLQRRIAEDINKLNNIPNEHFSEVFIEMDAAENDNWREETGVYRPPSAPRSIPSEALNRIWGSQHVRVFLSHKSSVKVETSQLKQSFNRCGIAAFVAHEDIEPTEEWQREIDRALFSMDALVALLTDDFHDSNWTDQEVGVAIGRGVPLIAVRLGKDPYGLMGIRQGLGGCSWSDTNDMAIKLFQLLYKNLPDKSRLFECALSAYMASNTFKESAEWVEHLLSVFETLTSEQVDRIVDTYWANGQNNGSFKGTELLQPLLIKWTGKPWRIENNQLIIAKPSEWIPF